MASGLRFTGLAAEFDRSHESVCDKFAEPVVGARRCPVPYRQRPGSELGTHLVVFFDDELDLVASILLVVFGRDLESGFTVSVVKLLAFHRKRTPLWVVVAVGAVVSFAPSFDEQAARSGPDLRTQTARNAPSLCLLFSCSLVR